MATKPIWFRLCGLFAAAGMLLATSAAWAQSNNALFANRAVGGVMIDASGMLQAAALDARGEIRKIWQQNRQTPPAGLTEAAAKRRISLKNLEATLAEYASRGEPLPEAVQCLGGLTEIDYVLVYPEQNDIVLVGPAEPWQVNEKGAFVGAVSGRPTMLLDDLIVALRAVFAPQPAVFSCSIDPTAEGSQRLRAYFAQLRTRRAFPQAEQVKAAFGPQVVSVQGVPADSHFARVLVAADYHMKRISMGVEQAPVAGLPSFMQLVMQSRRVPSNMLPRWWLAPDYQPVLKDEDGMAWHIQKIGVKTMVEADVFNQAGERETGAEKVDPVFKQWAELMTQRYEELAVAEPVFGELRNCMELSVVAACIAHENLLQKANLEIPTMLEGVDRVTLPTPKQVAPETVAGKIGRNWVFATGGVMINPWQIVTEAQVDAAADVRAQLGYAIGENWWAN
ncbi:MAG: DUF1598 domain-containing protein [Planctomycetota bacterium]|nr:MAG: DUF1598 domain-containing protein [Planctomycetota bacterium]